MNSGSLIYNGNSISAKDILENNIPEHNDNYLKSVIEYSREWLSESNDITIHTSGSTGEPKLIRLFRSQILASISLTKEALGLSDGDSMLISLPVNFVGGRMMLYRGWQLGMKMYVIPPEGNPLQQFREKIDFYSFTPYQLYSVLFSDAKPLLAHAKAVLVGGAKVNEELYTLIQKMDAPVWNSYGMTETVSHIALRRLNGKQPDFHLRLLKGIQIKKDERGCLAVRGPVTNNEWIITNDLVDFISENEFDITGRVDNIINTGGIKVQAEKIEEVIVQVFHEMNLHNRFIIVGLPDAKLGAQVSFIIEGNISDSLMKEVQEKISVLLSRYEMPRTIKFVKQFTYTPTGKIDRPAVLKSLTHV